MSGMTLSELSARMRGIDFAMLSTHTTGGEIAARPMSNNGEVEYTGESFFFSRGGARTVSDIESDPKVSLGFQGRGSPDGAPGLFIAIEGEGTLIRDKAAFEKHWTPDIERWFERGVDTPGLVLIRVAATRIRYWGEDEGEIVP